METAAAAAPASPVDREIRRLREWQRAGRHAEALRDARHLLRDRPENRDLALIVAIGLRNLGRVGEALAALESLERSQPRFSRLYQERGLCHLALKDAAGAIDAFCRAVRINPALPASWSLLEGLYRANGDAKNADASAAHVGLLERLPPDVMIATSLFSDGELAPAENIVRAYLLRHGDHPEAMRLLARIALAHDVLDEAERLLSAVLTLSPGYHAARCDYADTLARRHKYKLASEQVEPLLMLEPGNPDYRILAATVATGLGDHTRAAALYRELIAEQPRSPDLHLRLAHALKTVGRVPEAIAAYRAAAVARPDFGDAYWSLANLKTYRFGDGEIARMRAAEASPATSPVDRIHLCFALGKALEDRDDVAASWEYYARGNALMRSENRYRPERIEASTAEQIEVCTRDFFARRTGWGTARRDPIFILGLPRSGSTLLEQILASHSQVEGTQELAEIPRMVRDLQGHDPAKPRYPAMLETLTSDDVRRLGEAYLSDTQAYRTGKPFFIDKMPNNFRHIGLIHLMLPNARIIDVRREPMSCCFSNLKQLFADGQEFAYSATDVARYYRAYLELMRHWDEVLPGRILRVHYEDVVADLEGSVRRMLDHCGLAFEPACMAFHETDRNVHTPSSEQVRRPIFRDGLDQWTKYKPWLTPLQAALGDALVRYRG
ncbi:MAG: sulfotransferase [Rhizomicrobium sp.]